MKKKLLSLLLTIALVISLSACGLGEQKENQNSSEVTSQKDETDDSSKDDDKSGETQSEETDTQSGDTQSGNENEDEKKDTQSERNSSEDDSSDKSESDKNESDNNSDSGNGGTNSGTNDTGNNSGSGDSSNTGGGSGDAGNGSGESGGNSSSNSGSNSGNNSGSNSGSGNNSGAPITPIYIASFTAKENELADAVVAKIITSDMGDFERVKAIHDYLLMNVDYDYVNYKNDTIPMDSHRAIGALANKTAVCDGYAYAFKLLCLKVGVDCELVTGTSKGEGHAWNHVKVEGEWYNIDVTWDDPATVNGVQLAFDDHTGNSYEYFCIPDSIMNKDHDADDAKYTCTSPSLFERALKAGVPWDNAQYVASEKELISLLKTEAEKNNANPSFYIKASTTSGDISTFLSKCLSKAGIDYSSGYSIAYSTYFENTTDPETYYKFTISIANNGTVITHPVVSTMDELKSELLKARQAGQTNCLIYYYTNLIAWDNYDSACMKIIYAECSCYTGIGTYWPTDNAEIPQLSRFEFY